MLRSSDRVHEMEAGWARSLYATMDYPEALARFTALWNQAELLSPGMGQDWEEDIKADIALARILNGLTSNT
jgi:hypothetical protein